MGMPLFLYFDRKYPCQTRHEKNKAHILFTVKSVAISLKLIVIFVSVCYAVFALLRMEVHVCTDLLLKSY